jgi:hypothetical protein
MLTGMQQSADVVVAARKTTYFHLVDPFRTLASAGKATSPAREADLAPNSNYAVVGNASADA